MGGTTRGGDAVRAEQNGLVAVLAFAGIIMSLSQTLVIPLLARLPEILGTSATNAAWVVTVTLLSGAVGGPVMGRLGDLYPKKYVMIGCTLVMVAGSVLCALSTSLWPMLVGRALQGLGIGVIPIGPGPDPAEIVDFGIAHRSNAGLNQKYAFRTPPLRNVALTAPYMHNGAYVTLEAAVRHHLQPERSLDQYDPTQLEPEFRGAVHDDPLIHRDLKRTLSKALRPLPRLDDREVDLLLAFLHSLTAPSASQLGGLVPDSVPSGLNLIGPLPPKD